MIALGVRTLSSPVMGALLAILCSSMGAVALANSRSAMLSERQLEASYVNLIRRGEARASDELLPQSEICRRPGLQAQLIAMLDSRETNYQIAIERLRNCSKPAVVAALERQLATSRRALLRVRVAAERRNERILIARLIPPLHRAGITTHTHLLRVLLSDTDEDVVGSCLVAIGELRLREASASILPNAISPNPIVAHLAAVALVKLGVIEAEMVHKVMMHSRCASVRDLAGVAPSSHSERNPARMTRHDSRPLPLWGELLQVCEILHRRLSWSKQKECILALNITQATKIATLNWLSEEPHIRKPDL